MGIESAIFRLLAEFFNQLRYRLLQMVPFNYKNLMNFLSRKAILPIIFSVFLLGAVV
jgi:hypothetical protein